jgi:hypothetical protein
MIFRLVKIIFFVAFIFSSCKKEEKFIHYAKPTNLFNSDGISLSWHQFDADTWPVVYLSVPAGATDVSQSIEYYTGMIESANPLDSFVINFGVRDVNIFKSTCENLNTPALLSIPFPSTINFTPLYNYFPYKVKINGTDHLWEQLNDSSNWELITNYTFDNTAKTITFEITDLNACYVIAKHN